MRRVRDHKQAIFITACLLSCLLRNTPVMSAQPTDIGVNPAVSSCGGFDVAKSDARQRSLPPEQTEVIYWEYRPSERRLKFIHKNVFLNCCGDHAITAVYQPSRGAYQIEEIDQPKAGGSRCRCRCQYDFKIELSPVNQEAINIELYRHVTDAGDRQQIWFGKFDLSLGSGQIEI